MEILGIGWQELIFIVMIAIIVLGPNDMQKAGRTIGRWLNHLIQSDSWKVFQKTSSELRNLPRNLMREANMEMREAEKELRRSLDPRLDPPASSVGRDPSITSKVALPPSKEPENTTQSEPPADKADAPAAVPGGESSAEDGARSTRDPDEHV
jgi:Sec-independent protein translocase protein TatA